MISRKQFLALTKLDSDGLAALKRRDQIPIPNKADREYSPFEAFTYLVCDRLVDAPNGHSMNRTIAAATVRDAASLITARGDEIEASAETFRKGDGSSHIYAGRLMAASAPPQGFVGTVEEAQDHFKQTIDQIPRWLPFVGTKAEFAERIAQAGTLFEVVLTNITAAFVVLTVRAQREDISLAGMWPDPASLPTAEQIHADRLARIKANYRAVVDEVNKDRGLGGGE